MRLDTVKYAIHPVAGRMPGHMNVLLAGRTSPMTRSSNSKRSIAISPRPMSPLSSAPTMSPTGRQNPSSPIYGMPILDVERAKTVLFVKRSMASGYAGVENELFYATTR